jgi:hypothetical protein
MIPKKSLAIKIKGYIEKKMKGDNCLTVNYLVAKSVRGFGKLEKKPTFSS